MQATTVIRVEHIPDSARLNALGVFGWGIWTREVSRFPWIYDSEETCCLLDDDVIVTPDRGAPVRKRYRFG